MVKIWGVQPTASKELRIANGQVHKPLLKGPSSLIEPSDNCSHKLCNLTERVRTRTTQLRHSLRATTTLPGSQPHFLWKRLVFELSPYSRPQNTERDEGPSLLVLDHSLSCWHFLAEGPSCPERLTVEIIISFFYPEKSPSLVTTEL